MSADLSALELAEARLREVLQTQWQGIPALVLNSPPGAGKTGVAERLAVQSLALIKERVMIATQTNEQAFDLTRRLAAGFSKFKFYMMTSESLEIPGDILALSNLTVVHGSYDLPPGPVVAIGNAAKWSWLDADDCQFDLQIVDEAYQLPDYRFHQIAGLARRHVLIGDPGQIDPVIKVEIERWRSDAAGPHVPAPRALVERHPGVMQLSLPVSRRLDEDSAQIVQPAFYPELEFVALHKRRPLSFAMRGVAPMDTPLDAVTKGQSLVMVELPALLTGDVDHALADEMVWTIRRLLKRGASFCDDTGEKAVTPARIGVACARVAQVNAIRERLGPDLADVFVETANRFQGLERDLMFVQHPLSGRADASEFYLEAGRLCVLLSRHRVACWIFSREGVGRQLRRYAPRGDRSLGISDDPEFDGWRANSALMQSLTQKQRIYSVPERNAKSDVG